MTQSSETTIRTDAQRASSSRKLGRLSLIPTAAAAVAGWSASFIGLHGFAVRQMAGFTVDTAWLVPGAFDLSAFGSTVLVYRASINGRSGFRSRVMMYLFTALSAWINWIHQDSDAARFVACVLPVAAVIVFDGLAAEYRADWEADHGKKAFRMRLGLLLLRRMVDKEGTRAAFREQITAIPVSALVGLGADLATAELPEVTIPQPRPQLEQPAAPVPTLEQPAPAAPAPLELEQQPAAATPKPAPVPRVTHKTETHAAASILAGELALAEPPAWESMTLQAAVERADAILTGSDRPGHTELAEALELRGLKSATPAGVRQCRTRARKRAEAAAAGEGPEDSPAGATVTVLHPHGAQSA